MTAATSQIVRLYPLYDVALLQHKNNLLMFESTQEWSLDKTVVISLGFYVR